MEKKGVKKKAQVTIFIIIAIAIIVLGVLIYLFYPQIKVTLGLGTENPEQFLNDCLKDDVENAVESISLQGGYFSPDHYIVYKSENIQYLCYINENYQKCVVQQPMLKNHIELEIKKQIGPKARECLAGLENSYKKKGYNVNLGSGDLIVELLPKRIVLKLNNSLSIAKGEESQSYNGFRVFLNNNLYELVSIANSILEWETLYGDAETTTYMAYYKDLKVEKKVQIEGSKIYVITDRNNGNKFQFASRSVVWPPGYV